MMEKELSKLDSIFRNTPSDMLIISNTGVNVFWKIKGVINNNYKSIDTLDNTNGKLDYIKQIKSFVGNKYNKPAVLYTIVYQSKEKKEEKKEYFIPSMVKIKDEMIGYLSEHPELLENIDKDTLKKIIELKFEKDNYNVQIWPNIEDEYQAFALIHDENIGPLLILVRIVENEITFETVKQMRMTMEKIDANKGFIVTTSNILNSELNKNIKFRLSLIDAEKLQQWPQEYNKGMAQ